MIDMPNKVSWANTLAIYGNHLISQSGHYIERWPAAIIIHGLVIIYLQLEQTLERPEFTPRTLFLLYPRFIPVRRCYYIYISSNNVELVDLDTR